MSTHSRAVAALCALAALVMPDATPAELADAQAAIRDMSAADVMVELKEYRTARLMPEWRRVLSRHGF